MTAPAPALLLRRADLLSQGLSDNHIRRALGSGELTSIVPGVYLRTGDLDELDPVARHRAAVRAVVPLLVGDPVVSHLSAAVLLGLISAFGTADGLFPAPVHVTRAGPTKSRRGQLVQVHRARLTPAEAVRPSDGPAVTSVPRTVLDCALTLPFRDAVDVADAALSTAAVTTEELAAQLVRHSRTPGIRRAAAVLDVTRAGPR